MASATLREVVSIHDGEQFVELWDCLTDSACLVAEKIPQGWKMRVTIEIVPEDDEDLEDIR